MLGRYHGSGDATLGEGTTPFLRAAKAVDVPFMRALLEGGADPTLTKKDRTNAAMLVAAGQANSGYLGPGPDAAISATLEALTMCVDRGVDLNAFNTAGQTAMHVAAGRGLDAGGEVPRRTTAPGWIGPTNRDGPRSMSHSGWGLARLAATTAMPAARAKARPRCCGNS